MTNTALSYTISFQCGQWWSTRKRSSSPPELLLLGRDDAVENEEDGGGGDAVVDEAGELPGLLRWLVAVGPGQAAHLRGHSRQHVTLPQYRSVSFPYSPYTSIYFPLILRIHRQNGEYAEKKFLLSTMPDEVKGKYYEKIEWGDH